MSKQLNLLDDEKICCVCGKRLDKTRRKDGKIYCGRHYQQLYKYGKILKKTKFDPNEFKIFENYVEVYIDKNNKRYTVILSIESFNNVKQFKLYLRKDGYVAFKNYITGKTLLLHRYLMNEPDSCYEVDHINKNKLDNRLENLRTVTKSVNRINTDMMKSNTSGVIGVTWDKSRNKWKATLNVNHICYNLGRFNTLEEAKVAREDAEQLYHNDFLEFKRRHKNDKNKPNQRISRTTQ